MWSLQWTERNALEIAILLVVQTQAAVDCVQLKATNLVRIRISKAISLGADTQAQLEFVESQLADLALVSAVTEPLCS